MSKTAPDTVDQETGEILSGAAVVKTDDAQTALALRSTEAGALVPRLTAREMLARLAAKAVELTDDEESVSDAIAEAILAAETFEQILASQETVGSIEMIDVPFELLRTSMSPSTRSEKPSVYLILRGKLLDNGDSVNITCGAKSVVIQALVLEERGFLPAQVVIRQKKQATARGRYPQWLEAHVPGAKTAEIAQSAAVDASGATEEPF